jgi:hypothetical protein
MAAIPQGAIRFNTDSQKLEFYAQDQWWEMVIDTPALGTSSDTGAGARGVFGGGYTTIQINEIEYITISSTGNAIDFGDLTTSRYSPSACSSSTRGVFSGGGGGTPGWYDTIDYITISSTGNAQDFGNLISARGYTSSVSNQTRGIVAGGYTPADNTIQYMTIASTGDTKDFGDLSVGKYSVKGCSSTTRGLFSGGWLVSTFTNTIEFVTISTLGNSSDFGDLTNIVAQHQSFSNPVRGIFGGGIPAGLPTTCINVISYVTIATTGNSQDFGDLSNANNRDGSGGCSSPTRGIFAGGDPATSPLTPKINIIEYVTIMSTGNALDFGDLTVGKLHMAACSNAHGGL